MQINVFTVDGEYEANVETPNIGHETFDAYAAHYIDTEGQPAFSGGYVVQLIDDDGNLIAEDTQENYIAR